MTTPWFELLSEKKLLAHLSSDSPDPSAQELIVKLIAYAPRPVVAGADVEFIPYGGSGADERRSAASLSLQQTARAARRVAGLQYKLLAVQVFAHCQWRFPALDKRVPLPMQQTLLTTLLTVCGGTALSEVACHADLALDSLPPQALFAVSLYHRWVLWSVCQLAMPSRPQRNAAIPLPGQQDPAVVMPHVSEAARQSVEAQAAGSLELLARLQERPLPMLLPSVQTFGRYTETTTEPEHDWHSAAAVTQEELVCQLNFELGRYHFFKGDYSDAGLCFTRAETLYRSAPWRRDSQFVWLNEAELTGYCLAVSGCPPPMPRRQLYHRLRSSVVNGYREIVDILLEDNVSQELPMTTRDTVARDVAALVARRAERVPADLAHRIDILNCVRRALEDHHQVVDLSAPLAGSARLQRLLLDAVLEALPACESSASPDQCRERLRLLLLRTGQHAPGLVAALAHHGAGAALYSPEELEDLVQLHTESEEAELPTDPPPAATGIHDPVVEVGCLERRLMESYSPPELAAILRQLAALKPGRPLWRANTHWQLPIPVQSVIMSLPAGFLRDYFYIVMAKANELLQLKRFDGSRELLQSILEEAQSGPAQQTPTAAKLVRLIGWEKLLADLLQLLHNWPKIGDYRELTPRAKSCLSALKGSEVIPRSELVEHCTLYLLNVCQWDHLIDHLSEQERRGWTQMELAALLAAVCRELVNKGNDRQMSRNLWNAVIPMFTVSGQQKRTALGTCSSVQRDSPLAIMPRTQLTQFIQKVHEHTSLSVLTSLLTRLHNILLDDSTREMSLEHAGLWPNVVNNTSLFSLGSVSECLQTLLAQGIRLYPAHIPWLQGMADLRYAGHEPTSSLRHYLEACLVSSEYFSRPVPRTVLSEAVLRRMIKCCSALHCYTQAAVLCQFLDDVDYASAFQYASERSCSDAMDAYYECVWDVTLLEFLTSLHHRRAERTKRQQVIKLIGQLELNSNNNEEIQREAAAVRKARFLRAMVKQYAA